MKVGFTIMRTNDAPVAVFSFSKSDLGPTDPLCSFVVSTRAIFSTPPLPLASLLASTGSGPGVWTHSMVSGGKSISCSEGY